MTQSNLPALTINFIGCGRLGKTLAKLFHLKNVAKISGIVNSTFASSLDAATFVGVSPKVALESLKKLKPADIYSITTPDDKIQQLCLQLSAEGLLKKGAIVAHCSGALSSDILESAKQDGCYVASIHSLKSFANPEVCVKNFTGPHCTVEGDREATSILSKLFQEIGGIVLNIKKEQKQLYHLASVMANNYLVTLHHLSRECYRLGGMDEDLAQHLVTNLMKGALDNLNQLDYKKSLTGPISRGDVETVKSHIAALSVQPSIQKIYKLLGAHTLLLTDHSTTITYQFNELFD